MARRPNTHGTALAGALACEVCGQPRGLDDAAGRVWKDRERTGSEGGAERSQSGLGERCVEGRGERDPGAEVAADEHCLRGSVEIAGALERGPEREGRLQFGDARAADRAAERDEHRAGLALTAELAEPVRAADAR